MGVGNAGRRACDSGGTGDSVASGLSTLSSSGVSVLM